MKSTQTLGTKSNPYPAEKKRFCILAFGRWWPISSLELQSSGAVEVRFSMVENTLVTIIMLPGELASLVAATEDWSKPEVRG